MGKKSKRLRAKRKNKYAPRPWARYRRWDQASGRTCLVEGRWDQLARRWIERLANWAPSAPLYFAYGSNLNVAQMARRAPDAVKFSSLVLPNWALKFRGVADIAPEAGASVQGGLWRITGADEAALDTYEGVRSGLYGKHYFDIVYTRVGDTEPTTERVLVYIMGNARSESRPWGYYLNTIRQGYADFGLNESFLDAAIAATPQPEPFVWSAPVRKTSAPNYPLRDYYDYDPDDGDYPGHSHHRYHEGGYARRQAALAEERDDEEGAPRGYSGAWPPGFESDWDGE